MQDGRKLLAADRIPHHVSTLVFGTIVERSIVMDLFFCEVAAALSHKGGVVRHAGNSHYYRYYGAYLGLLVSLVCWLLEEGKL